MMKDGFPKQVESESDVNESENLWNFGFAKIVRIRQHLDSKSITSLFSHTELLDIEFCLL